MMFVDFRPSADQKQGMAKHNYTFDHPSDIGLAARADSLGELMEALAEGLAGEICDRDQVAAAQSRTLEVSVETDQAAAAKATPDYESLAVDFLTAVMNLIQVRHFMVREASVQMPSVASAAGGPAAGALVAQLTGEPYEPERHEIKVEIKAVTYHQLTIKQEGGQWVGRVIVDI
jgi:SHS2 domain-containing protein